jgi:hypothetical protein
MITMNSDILHTNHRRLELAFKSAAYARNRGALEVTIEWKVGKGEPTAQYAFQKTSDGIYARLRGCTTSEAIMRIHNFALRHSLPFSPTGSWARTDGTPVTA